VKNAESRRKFRTVRRSVTDKHFLSRWVRTASDVPRKEEDSGLSGILAVDVKRINLVLFADCPWGYVRHSQCPVLTAFS
jgi:hypothetical protein